MKNKSQKYFIYLQKKSFLGILYRNYYLYPQISKMLRGFAIDIGSGIGDFLRFRSNTVGADVNPFLVDHCLSLNLEAHLIHNDIIPFPSGSFDSVILDNVIEHISNPVLLIKEINRVVKKKGILVIGIPGHLGFKSDQDHKVFYTEEDCIFLLKKYGFFSIQ